MRILDISVTLSPDLPVYPGDPPVDMAPWTRMTDGDSANVSRVTLCTHSGTHIDVPRHFSDQGEPVDVIPLEVMVGDALVLEIAGAKVIGRKELERLPVRGHKRLLLKTDNSGPWEGTEFNHDFVALSVDGAEYLVELGVKLVGIDYLSIEAVEGDGTVHKLLLNERIVILEGINLAGVMPGEYELICLPLKIADADGAPVRAILRGGPEPPKDPLFDPHTTKWPLS
jgi:arylformamidase